MNDGQRSLFQNKNQTENLGVGSRSAYVSVTRPGGEQTTETCALFQAISIGMLIYEDYGEEFFGDNRKPAQIKFSKTARHAQDAPREQHPQVQLLSFLLCLKSFINTY